MSKVSKLFSNLSAILFFGIIVFAIILSSFGGLQSADIQAQDARDEYIITNYDVTAEYKEDNTLIVQESITANFLVFGKHGIYRGLPEVSQITWRDSTDSIVQSKKLRLKYSLTSCLINNQQCDYQYESYNDYKFYAFGNQNIFLNKNTPYNFKFSYVVTLDSRFVDYEMFYYNVLGNAWDTNIQNFSATVKFAESLGNEYINTTEVFCGKYGQDDHPTVKSWNTEKTILSVSATNLDIGEGVTVKLALPEGYATASQITAIDYVMLVAIIGTIIISILIYVRNSNKHSTTPVVQFEAVNDYTSADVGYIIDKKVNTEDIASLIIFWAEKGYLNIIEEDKQTYIEATEKSTKKMKSYEKKLFKAIFGNKVLEESRVDIDDVGEQIKETVVEVKKKIAEENQAYFDKKAVVSRGVMIVLVSLVLSLSLIFVNYQNVNDLFVMLSIIVGIATMIFLFVFASYIDKKDTANQKNKFLNMLAFVLYSLAMIVMCIFSFDSYCDPFLTVFLAFIMLCVAMYLIYKFNVRTDEGCEALGNIIGLKAFIEVAEVDRLKMLASEDPKMFYKVMPFAYVFGLYDKWCKKFEKIDIAQPDFYRTDSDVVFDFIIFNHLINASTNAIFRSINTANMSRFTEHLGNTTGGFSGGGFSGGGLGGGGGGSW